MITINDKFFSKIKSVDYLIICERIEVEYRPELEFLLDPYDDDIPDNLDAIIICKELGRRIVIYEID